MKNDLNDLKKLTLDLIKNGSQSEINEKNQSLIEKFMAKRLTWKKAQWIRCQLIIPMKKLIKLSL